MNLIRVWLWALAILPLLFGVGCVCSLSPNLTSVPFDGNDEVFCLSLVDFVTSKELERPGQLSAWLLSTSGHHDGVEKVAKQPVSFEEFWQRLRGRVQREQRLIVFVHGFSTPLTPATLRAKNLDSVGPVLMIKWATPRIHRNWLTRRFRLSDTYRKHVAIGQEAIPEIAEILDKVAQEVNTPELVLVGHSHGAHLVAEAFKSAELKATHLVFVAADTEPSKWEGESGHIASWLREGRLGKFTNYASTGDYALGASRISNKHEVMGSLHRVIAETPVDLIDRYSIVDVGCLKGAVRRDDIMYGHTEFFFLSAAISDFRTSILGLAPLSTSVSRERILQSEIKTIAPQDQSPGVVVYRIREVGRPCSKEREPSRYGEEVLDRKGQEFASRREPPN